MKRIKEMLRDTKVQCSGATKETQELYAKVGIELPEADFIYIDRELHAEAVSPSVFKVINCKEVGPGNLKAWIEKVEKEGITYAPGTVITAEKDGSNATAIVIEDMGDHVKCIGQDLSGELIGDYIGYTKPRIRKANASEVTHLFRQFKDLGFRPHLVDGIAKLFYFRPKDQDYYYLDVDFIQGISVKKTTEDYHKSDDYNYSTGNYFETEEEAKKAAKELFANFK